MTTFPVWSFSLLKAFEQCPRQANHRYLLKDQPREKSEALDWGIEVHDAMERALKTGAPLPDKMAAYRRFLAHLKDPLVEIKLGIQEDGAPCGFFDGPVWGRGKLDVALLSEDSAVIIDWKTGKKREEPDELEIFAVLLKAHYPRLKRISGFYVWLKENKAGAIHKLSDTVVKLAEIRGRFERIKQMIRAEHFPPRQTPLCGWCSVKTCEFHPGGTR